MSKFHLAVEDGDWYEAAREILLLCNTEEDPQDWLSGGDKSYLMENSAEDLAREWEEEVSHQENISDS